MINDHLIYGETISLLWVKLYNLNIASLSMESALLFCGSMRCARAAVSLCDVLDSFTRTRLWMPWVSFNWTLYVQYGWNVMASLVNSSQTVIGFVLNLKINHRKGQYQCHSLIYFITLLNGSDHIKHDDANLAKTILSSQLDIACFKLRTAVILYIKGNLEDSSCIFAIL